MLSAANKMRERVLTCHVCGSVDTVHWKARDSHGRLVPEDLQITDFRYGVTLSLWKCRECGFIFAGDEEINELTSLYERLSDPEYEKSQVARAYQMRWLLKVARKANPNAVSLLDVGAGAGLLVAEARRLQLDAVGVEPSRAFVDSALSINAVEILHGVFPHPVLTGRQFDLIFLVDVIEHVSNPVELLQSCAEALSPSGMVIVVTPDVASFPAKILGQRWWHFRLAHVGYFNPHSLRIAAEAAGLSTVRRFRAEWFLPVRYVAERVAQYLPIEWINRLASRVQPLRWLYDRVIPLNLHDSFVVFLRRADVRLTETMNLKG
jgi:2-polyprenyl-3-methyl-5-hydroxy-6-metoxy-1,4-benzoquinol methylase